MRRRRCEKGFFVGLDLSSAAPREIGRFLKADFAVVIPFTVRAILDEQIDQKVA